MAIGVFAGFVFRVHILIPLTIVTMSAAAAITFVFDDSKQSMLLAE